jgi:beta-phosphoglucomutase-like phosphatase (HAD superfamily)
MPIRGVAFDLEGTLVDLEYAHHNAHLLTLRDLGMNLSLEDAVVKIPHFIGGPHERIIEEILVFTGSKRRFDYVSDLDHSYFESIRAQLPIVPRPGSLKVIRWFKEKGFSIAIGSLTDEAPAKLILDRSGLVQEFPPDCVVLKHDVSRLKPDPMVYQETARRMGIKTSEQLVFEDSPRGVIAGKTAGSPVIGMPVYAFVQATIPLLEAGASRIFMDWREMEIESLITNFA